MPAECYTNAAPALTDGRAAVAVTEVVAAAAAPFALSIDLGATSLSIAVDCCGSGKGIGTRLQITAGKSLGQANRDSFCHSPSDLTKGSFVFHVFH